MVLFCALFMGALSLLAKKYACCCEDNQHRASQPLDGEGIWAYHARLKVRCYAMVGGYARGCMASHCVHTVFVNAYIRNLMIVVWRYGKGLVLRHLRFLYFQKEKFFCLTRLKNEGYAH